LSKTGSSRFSTWCFYSLPSRWNKSLLPNVKRNKTLSFFWVTGKELSLLQIAEIINLEESYHKFQFSCIRCYWCGSFRLATLQRSIFIFYTSICCIFLSTSYSNIYEKLLFVYRRVITAVPSVFLCEFLVLLYHCLYIILSLKIHTYIHTYIHTHTHTHTHIHTYKCTFHGSISVS
jgi:hypothetical protein